MYSIVLTAETKRRFIPLQLFKLPKNEDAQIFTPTDRTRKSKCVFQINAFQLSHKTDCLGKLYLKYEKPLYFAKHRYKKVVKLNGSVT